MLGFISGQLSDLNWLMEAMNNTRTGLRRAGAPCVGGESRGRKRQGRKGGGEKEQSVFQTQQAVGSAVPMTPEYGS